MKICNGEGNCCSIVVFVVLITWGNVDFCIIKNLENYLGFLQIIILIGAVKEFSKVEIDIYENQSIALVYIPNKGYSLVLKENDDIQSVFLLKTDILPNNVNDHSDREDFINILKMLLDRIYGAADIKEYEKQHQEHVFLRLMDMLNEGTDVESISEETSKIYTDIEKGFMKLELDIMDNKINALNHSVTDVSNNLDSTVKDIEENAWGNRIRKTINQQ